MRARMPGSLGHEKPAPAPSTTASSVKTGMLRLNTHKLKARCSSVCTAVRRFSAPFLAKRPLARLLSTFLCCLAIVVRPVARLGGRYAFLVLPFQALIFGVQESLAQQLELSVLNTMGALAGIGFSTLGKYVAARAPYGSARSRATCAMFLIVISFFGESGSWNEVRSAHQRCCNLRSCDSLRMSAAAHAGEHI